MASANPRERPVSVATTATVQSEAPPPYSEYDDTFVPPPNEQTQAMLRGGYIVRQQQPDTPSMREYSPATAYMRGRAYSHRHNPNETITIARAIHPGIKAEGIPFPSEYPAITSRDVTPDDWSYFANCILRELEVPNVKGAIATPVTISEFRERQDMVDLTIDQWNRGFFGPRAIHIVPAYSFYRMPTVPETVRSSSPTPTYRTERTVSQDDEIMTITIDTSPRSTRAGTPDTIRELNAGEKTPPETLTPGTLTPRTVDEELAPPRVNTPRKNSIPRKPVLPKRPSELSLSQQTLTPESARHVSAKLSKVRRDSVSSVSSESSFSSLSSLDSDDDILNGDVPEIRRTLAEEFKRDPESKSHLKTALKQIRRDIAVQHKATLIATKSKRGELQAAAREHRKQMRGEMKELRKEIREYQRAHRAAGKRDRKVRKDQRKERKQIKQDFKNEAKKLEKEKKAIAKEIRKGRTPTDPVHSPTTPSPRSARHPPPGPWPMSGPNMSMPHLSGNNPSQTSLHNPPPGNDFSHPTGFRGRGQVPPRAMSTISFDGTGAAPQCSRERSPRPGGNGAECMLPTRRPNSRSSNGSEPNQCPIGLSGGGYGRDRIGLVGRRFGAGPFGSGGVGPISMAKDFLFQQAGASLERLRLDANHGTAARAGEEVYAATQKEGQETGVIKQ